MRIRALILALAFAGACSGQVTAETAKPAAAASAADTYFAQVETAAPSALLASEAEYRAFAQALGDRASLAFGTFTSDGAGAVARDVVVTIGGEEAAGLKIAELRLYRGAGNALAKGDVAAERLDARGISTFGVEKLLEKVTSAYAKAIVDGIEKATDGKADPEPAPPSDVKFDKYAYTVDRLVIDGLVLHAEDKKPASKAGAAAGDLSGLLRTYAAAGRAMSARAFVMRGAKAEMSSSAGGDKSVMSIAMPFIGERGVARGDVELAVMSDFTFEVSTNTAATATAPAVPFTMAGGVGRYTVTGLKLAKLLDYWARGESPPPKEVNLLSLGVWESRNERYTLGGAPVYSLDYAKTDLTKFRWFLPTSIRSAVTNLSYDLGGLMKFSAQAAPQGEKTAELLTMIGLMEKHGFSKITTSGETAYDWSPETGAATIVSANDMKTLGKVDFKAVAGLPAFKDFAGLHPKKGEAFDTTKLSALFADGTLTNASMTVADKGVLARGFALAADLQAVQAGGKPGAIKSDELRAGAAFSMRSLGAAPTPLAPVYAAVADFIAEGGALDLAVAPASPIPFALIMAPGPNGEDPLTRLNLTARRTAE